MSLWDEDTKRILRNSPIASHLSDVDFEIFEKICETTGLNPFMRQIYAIARKEKKKLPTGQWVDETKISYQVSIDGAQAVAHRTGEFTGMQGPFWCGEDGVWKDVWTSKEFPFASKVTVMRAGHPYSSVALWSEYAQTTTDYKTGETKPTKMWASLPTTMLSKVARAAALRMAFPQQLGGLYEPAEMDHATQTRDHRDSSVKQDFRKRPDGYEPEPDVASRQVDDELTARIKSAKTRNELAALYSEVSQREDLPDVDAVLSFIKKRAEEVAKK